MEVKLCLYCKEELNGRKTKYCSKSCKDKYSYHNDNNKRQKKIDSSKERVLEQREIEKARRKSLEYKELLEEVIKIDNLTKEEQAIQDLFYKIINK
jgi:hypothetical protein